ncbi:MAG TPA: BolA family protein [Steroidobacteraceae bacterium]|nr:BolA family protein [Steroidobacteraceae bacterium]
MSDRLERIRARLEQALTPLELSVEDESHLHAGHAGARSGRGHFRARIVARAFEGLNLLQRHRLVYEALGEIMQDDIHALRIEALAPAETARRAG